MARCGKKERMGFIIGSVLVGSAFEIGDPLGDGFRELVSVIRTPQLDEYVEVALYSLCASRGLSQDTAEQLYAEYTRWS